MVVSFSMEYGSAVRPGDTGTSIQSAYLFLPEHWVKRSDERPTYHGFAGSLLARHPGDNSTCQRKCLRENCVAHTLIPRAWLVILRTVHVVHDSFVDYNFGGTQTTDPI